MFNNNTTVTCPQSVPNFENRSIFDKDMDNHKVGRFLRHSVDFEDPSLDFLGSRKRAHKGIKDRYPP